MLCRIERRPPRLDLTVYPYLPRASVVMTSAKAYLDLLTGASPVNFSIYPLPVSCRCEYRVGACRESAGHLVTGGDPADKRCHGSAVASRGGLGRLSTDQL